MSDKKRLVIFGSAEIAELAHFYFKHDSEHEIVAFTVDDAYVEGDTFNGLPIVPWSEAVTRFPPDQYGMHVALSYMKLNRLRQAKFEQAKAAGYSLASYICSRSATWPDLVMGENCFILENQTIQPTVKLGDNVMLWSGNHIGHGTHIGSHTYFASHIVVSGHCRIGERCFFGVNATLRDFLKVGDEAFIAMDASLTKDVEAGSVVLGAPATVFGPDDPKGRRIRNNYFGLDD
ncbi:acetyltransferase [Hyphobacterium sp. HN65]|uniref:Acetyltransferase n=1 Tax=Hyphobacterium lacteum TaxID=3116575 RepID=A0ABU7LQM4_9PROT|nr:acetyltransferase [Hyphobacterium sp. HN65]MEE2526207.1 acetyltransferase [Hyphobacterium sp. HN65]